MSAIPTPPPPSGTTVTYTIEFPVEIAWQAIVWGMVANITQPEAWEQSTGGATPTDAASVISEILFSVQPE